MKYYTAGISNTLVDSHGERMTKEALEQLVASVNESYIPVGIEHDPRIPPQGRIASAEVRERADGEFEAVATFEIFDENTDLASSDEREILMSKPRGDGIYIASDRSYASLEDKKDIEDIAKVLGTQPTQEIKKAAEPISILWIIGSVAASAFAAGFFGKAGSDAWDVLRQKLAKLMERRAICHEEYLLVFSFSVDVDGAYRVEVDVALENPRKEDIEAFLEIGMKDLDLLVPAYVRSEESLRKLFFSFSASSELELTYAVRKDCVPMKFNHSTKDVLNQLKP